MLTALRTPELPLQSNDRDKDALLLEKEQILLAKVAQERERRLKDDRPRDIFRVRKRDCVTLPPLTHNLENNCCPRYRDEKYEENIIDLGRFVDNLLPDIGMKSEVVRTTQKSPLCSERNDLGLWAELIAVEIHDQRRSQRTTAIARGNVLSYKSTSMSSLPNFNHDLLEKEVAIKRILEHHRPMLLRSLRDIGHSSGRIRFRDSSSLVVEGQVGEENIKSDAQDSGRCSSLSDSAFGEWGGRESTDDYLPSQRTLVTDDVLHSQVEQISASDKEKEEMPEEVEEEVVEEEEIVEVEDEGEEVEVEHCSTTTSTQSTVESAHLQKVQSPAPTPKAPAPRPAFVLPPRKLTPVEIPPIPPPRTPTPEPLVQETPPKAPSREKSPLVASPPIVELEDKSKPDTRGTTKTGASSSQDVSSRQSMKSDISSVDDFVPVKREPDEWDAYMTAMLNEDGEEEGEEDKVEEKKEEDKEDTESEEDSISLRSSLSSVTPFVPYTYKPKSPMVIQKIPTPPRSPTPPVVVSSSPPLLQSTSPEHSAKAKRLPPPPKKRGLTFAEEENLRKKREEMERAHKKRGRRAARLRKPDPPPVIEAEMVPVQEPSELTGAEEVSEILEKFLIIDKGRVNYLLKIFNDYDMRRESCLTHKELKKALSQLKACTRITRNQLKFIELVLGVDKSSITFHTFAVLATMIEHMAHKDPTTAEMFECMDMTRLEHDLPRLKRLFHCVSERDDFGWPRLTTKALDIELRAGGIKEQSRNKFIDALDPDKKGEMSIFDFIIYMPLWMSLHDGIVDNPLSEISRDIVTPIHRNWGVSVLWLPEENAVDPRASPRSGCGSDRSTPAIYIESPSMRRVLGDDDYDEDEDEEGIVNSDEG